jgi:hypothetical protein
LSLCRDRCSSTTLKDSELIKGDKIARWLPRQKKTSQLSQKSADNSMFLDIELDELEGETHISFWSSFHLRSLFQKVQSASNKRKSDEPTGQVCLDPKLNSFKVPPQPAKKPRACDMPTGSSTKHEDTTKDYVKCMTKQPNMVTGNSLADFNKDSWS